MPTTITIHMNLVLSVAFTALLMLAQFFAIGHAKEGVRHYDGYKLYKVVPASQPQLEALHQLHKMAETNGREMDFWKFHPQLGMPSQIFVSPEGEESLKQFLRERAFVHHLLVDDFGIQMREATVRFDEPENAFFSPDEFDLGRYHRYESIVQYLQMLAKAHPQFTNFSSIGKTSEGRDLAIIKLGYPSANGNVKPILLIDAGIHAREWIAPAMALHVINALVKEPKWHALLKDIDVHIIPSLNPDGYIYSWDKDRMWRRTRSGPYPTNGLCVLETALAAADPSVCYGADPNRNFPFHWAESGTESCPCSEIYTGPKALSEPECAHLAQFMRANVPHIKAYLTLHAFGNLLIHAWNYARKTYPEDVADIRTQAQRMVQAIVVQGQGPPFSVGSAPDILYEAAGGSDDYASSLGIKYSYTMELTSGSFERFHGGFVYPERAINPEAAKVLPGIFELAAKVREIGAGAN